MKQQVVINLGNALHYLDFKLVEITILEVIANTTGGDAPYFLLIGESDGESSVAPIEQYFPVNMDIDGVPKGPSHPRRRAAARRRRQRAVYALSRRLQRRGGKHDLRGGRQAFVPRAAGDSAEIGGISD